ncbi:MAG: metallophosphoesterase family protein [Bryobacteraceae bacterium]|nr:metallophosphoesterase family protein [Bryobacteraceae bacterium]
MRIAILSDIHDNIWNVSAAVKHAREVQCEVLLCCGDLCSPFVMDRLRLFSGAVHIVFGNNDADLYRITQKSDDRVRVHGEFFEGQFGGRRVAMQHYDNIARGLAHSGLYDLVCYGHNHRLRVTRVKQTLAVNPGPLMGAAGFTSKGWEDVAATFLVYDTDSGGVAAFRVEGEGRVERHDFEIGVGWD